VITTPQGTGQPRNLWPETLTLPMPGFLNVTLGAWNMNEEPNDKKKKHGFRLSVGWFVSVSFKKLVYIQTKNNKNILV
jgi:hypothetical protein